MKIAVFVVVFVAVVTIVVNNFVFVVVAIVVINFVFVEVVAIVVINYVFGTLELLMCCLNSSMTVLETVMSLNMPSSFDVN